MHTVRAFLFLVVVFSNVSLLGQIDREWVKLDYNVIDSLVALDKNSPAEVCRFFSSPERDKLDLGFGWTTFHKRMPGGYASFDAYFYLYKDTIRSYVIKTWLPHTKELIEEYKLLYSRVMAIDNDGFYVFKYGKENILQPLDAYNRVGKRNSISDEMLQYMSPESGLEYGYRGGMANALLKNRSRFLQLKKHLSAEQVKAMMYSINPASRLTAIEYYLKNKDRFKITNETRDWIEVVYREVPEIYTMNGCLYGKRNSKELVAAMIEIKQQ